MRSTGPAGWVVAGALLLIALGIGALIIRPWSDPPATPPGSSPTVSPSGGPRSPGGATATVGALSASTVASAVAVSPRTVATGSGSAAPASAPGPAGASPAPASSPPSAAAPGSGAPISAVGFDPRHTVVPIAFPLPATARYRYGALWRVPRLGVVYGYNQIRGVTPGGGLLRGHDGVDLEVPIGTLVVAPFAGTVVDPAKVWKPWDPARYGKVVVIRSTETGSRGYHAMLVHLSRQSVAIGQVVKRGQVVGRTGISGNAAETTPHLHFELRAPFRIEFHYAGVKRLLDVFDPLPSLRRADPHL